MDRLEARELEYVVAVAEELSFTRAAARLGIAQPPLSRAIGRLERRLGVALFDRTSRSVSLTTVGASFLVDCRSIIEMLDTAVARVRASDRSRPLIIAMRPAAGSGLLRYILNRLELQRDPPPTRVLLTRSPIAAASSDMADVALTCLSHGTEGMQVERLTDRRTVVLLPARHPLADRAGLRLADVQALPGHLDECPNLSFDEIIDLVGLQGASILVSEDVTDRLGELLRAIPVTDAPRVALGLVYAAADTHPRLGEFLAHARRTASTHIADTA